MKSVFLVAPWACLVSFPALAGGLTPAETNAIDIAAAKVLQATGVPGASLAVVKDGAIAYVQAYGFAVVPGRKARPDMAFPIGSVSKQFTASLILLLARDGKLALDDKVSRFLPGLPHAQEVTLRQLLSHTSGYEDYAPEDYSTPGMTRATTPQAMAEVWASKPLDFVPGTQWQYSNTGYTIAGLVAEKAGGQPFFAQIGARILKPLHLDSAVDYDAHGVPQGGPAGYQRHALGPPRRALPDEPGWSFASGSLAMTASDLARWDITLMGGRLLGAAATAELETPVHLKDGTDTEYGLGVQLRGAGQDLVVYHSGEETGFTACNEVVPNRHDAVAVMTNQDATPASCLIARQAEQIAFGIAPVAPKNHAEALVLTMLKDLAAGHVEASRLNGNARFYFSPAVLADYRSSLAPLGPVLSLHERSHQARGGMTFHSYDVAYAGRRLVVTTYELPDGRLDQLLIEP
jgi:CubicO group peptidase (beta-lactamase class C family)